jgi:hypothetical protein
LNATSQKKSHFDWKIRKNHKKVTFWLENHL